MAARGVNKVILVGNVGNDPEIKQTNNGKVVANFTLATGEAWKDQQGQLQERTEWHRIVFFERTAEVVRDYVKKGAKLYVEGRLTTRKWQDKNGQDRYTTEIVGSEMQMLGAKGEGGGNDKAQSQAEHYGRGTSASAGTSNAGADPDFDDDIPF